MKNKLTKITSILILILGFSSSFTLADIKLKFMNYLDIPTFTDKEGKNPFQGISGISYDASFGGIVAVSDDPGYVLEKIGGIEKPTYTKNVSRFYKIPLNLSSEGGALAGKIKRVLLKDDGEPIMNGRMDSEGITVLPSGNYLIVTEQDLSSTWWTGYFLPQAQKKPNIYEFSPKGELLGMFEFPERFTNDNWDSTGQMSTGSWGVVGNRGVESICYIPGSNEVEGSLVTNRVVTLTEVPLIQDFKSSFSRLSVFATSSELPAAENGGIDTMEIFAEYPYKMDDKAEFKEDGGNPRMGVSDTLALSDDKFITIERTYVRYKGKPNKSVIRLYEVEIGDATDISSKKYDNLGISHEGMKIKPVKKKLILDIFKAGISSKHNIEGITLGPVLNDGSRVLILVSDNGDNPSNPTRLFFFKLLR